MLSNICINTWKKRIHEMMQVCEKIWQDPKKSRQGNGGKGLLKVIVGECFLLVFNSEVLNKL